MRQQCFCCFAARRDFTVSILLPPCWVLVEVPKVRCRVKMRSVWTHTVARCYSDDRSADPTTRRQPTWQPGRHDLAALADHDADVVARHGEHFDALVAACLCQWRGALVEGGESGNRGTAALQYQRRRIRLSEVRPAVVSSTR